MLTYKNLQLGQGTVPIHYDQELARLRQDVGKKLKREVVDDHEKAFAGLSGGVAQRQRQVFFIDAAL